MARLNYSEVFAIAENIAKDISGRYGTIEEELTKYSVGIASVESNFNPDAKNKNSSARGIMQILNLTQREVERKHAKVPYAPSMYGCKQSGCSFDAVSQHKDKMFEPEYNMLIGMNYLAYQYKRYGSWTKAIHAYNRGSYPGSDKQAGINYKNKVLARVSVLKQENPEQAIASTKSQDYNNTKNSTGISPLVEYRLYLRKEYY